MEIDFAILKPGILDKDFEELCRIGSQFRGICVPPTKVSHARRVTSNRIISVIGFPTGLHANKIGEAKEAVQDLDSLTDELDVVWNVDNFVNKHYLALLFELDEIVNLGFPVKVIVPGLEPKDAITAYHIVQDSGAFCIKTLFTDPRKNFPLLCVWHKLTGLKIKVSGGIDNYKMAELLVNKGADIIGTSTVLKC